MPSWLPFSPEALALVALIAGIYIYLRFLARHRRSTTKPTVAQADQTEALSETELERYARHIVMHDIGGAGQMRLKTAKILLIGAGGLGAPILSYLAAAGVGTIGVIDDDVVMLSNLQRQTLFKDDDLDRPKVFAAMDHLIAQNPYVNIRPYHRRFEQDIAQDLIAEYDLILDGSDNYTTRALVNRACVNVQKPLISGAISQWEGQISLFDPVAGGPCFACLFPSAPAQSQMQTCAQLGVLGALPGVIGAFMAAEAIKYITQSGRDLRGRLWLGNLLDHHYQIVAIEARSDCSICGGRGETKS